MTVFYNSFSACAHCLDCPTDGNTDGKCLLCEDGYIVNDDGTCQPCIDIEKDEDTCKACSDGHIGRFLKDDVCLCKLLIDNERMISK